MEDRPPSSQGHRAAALGAVPGGPGRVLHPPQRGLLRPRRRAARATSNAGRNWSPRPRRWTSSADAKAAQAQLREIQGQWHDTGRVPREVAGGLDRRLRAVEDKVKAAMDTAWRRTTPAVQPAARQMREQVARAEQQLAKALAAGDQRRIKDAEQALASKRRFLDLAERSG